MLRSHFKSLILVLSHYFLNYAKYDYFLHFSDEKTKTLKTLTNGRAFVQMQALKFYNLYN